MFDLLATIFGIGSQPTAPPCPGFCSDVVERIRVGGGAGKYDCSNACADIVRHLAQHRPDVQAQYWRHRTHNTADHAVVGIYHALRDEWMCYDPTRPMQGCVTESESVARWGEIVDRIPDAILPEDGDFAPLAWDRVGRVYRGVDGWGLA